MYWWEILQKGENELVYKFYSAQKLRPVKNDFVVQIQEDLLEIEWEISEMDALKLSKLEFKKILDKKVNTCARKYLERMKKSKTDHLIIDEKFSAAKYLFSKKLSVREIQTLFRLRSRTLNVKDNQKSSYKENMWCRTCHLFSETQEHILHCSIVRDKVKHLSIDFSSVSYNMIFGSMDCQEKLIKIYQIMVQARNDILNPKQSESSPSPSGGPGHQ